MTREQTDFDETKYRDVSVPIEEILARSVGLSIALLAAPVVLYSLIYGFGTFMASTFTGQFWLLALPGLILAIIAHEGLHALGWLLFGRLSWRAIRFGIAMRALSPYAHAKVPMSATAYRLGAVLPAILLGVVPALAGILVGNGPLTFFGAFMLSAAVGDFLVLWIIRDVPGGAQVLDHPSQAGCMVLVE